MWHLLRNAENSPSQRERAGLNFIQNHRPFLRPYQQQKNFETSMINSNWLDSAIDFQNLSAFRKHSKMSCIFIISTATVLFFSAHLCASTVGIATGKATIDGRPLLFKNKDRTDNFPSDVNFYQAGSGEYSYVFQQNDGQDHTRARMGLNSVGFGIVYTTSENLAGAASGPTGSELCAVALKSCSTLEHFRNLLDSTNGKRQVHEHYAVIDSSGAGAMFEVDGTTWVGIAIVDSIGTMANTAKFHPSAGPPASKSTSPDREARAEYLLTHGPEAGLDYQ